MSVGILLITHSGIGCALLNVAHGTFGKLQVNIDHLSVSRDPNPDLLITKAAAMVRKLDDGDGVLVLTDMFGSTPSNVAQGLQHQGFAIRVVTGLNLPMLFRALNYPNLPLAQLAKKAVAGAKDGIFEPLTGKDLIAVDANKKKQHAKVTRQRRIVVMD
jgi:PTS system mannose-specific IIA component